LSYDAASGCPTNADIVKKIEASSARVRVARGTEPAVDLAVRVEETENGIVGILDVQNPDGAKFSRTIPAPVCDEALSAIALIAAIAIDPDAASAGEAVPAATDSATPPPSALPPPPPLPPPPLPPPVDALDDVSAPRSGRRGGFSLGARLGVTGGVAPGLVPDFGVTAALDAPKRRWLAPRLELAAVYARSGTIAETGGSVRYDRLGARLSGCPLELLGLAAASLRPCALVELGRLHAQGSDVPGAQSRSVVWAGVGAGLRTDTDLPAGLTLGVEAGALFPLVRNGFFFEPAEQVVHRVDAIVVQAALELGYELW
jgi:hypothetical protein